MAKKGKDQCVILLAEDDVLVRNFIAALLTRKGFTVLAAADGMEAMELSRSYTGIIHLLLTDIRMPRMSGLDLSDSLVEARPGLKVLTMSGRISGEISSMARNWPLLKKPFLPGALLEMLAGIFDPDTEPQCAETAVGTDLSAPR
jgi:DNA-binding NtrC family response regulator